MKPISHFNSRFTVGYFVTDAGHVSDYLGNTMPVDKTGCVTFTDAVNETLTVPVGELVAYAFHTHTEMFNDCWTIQYLNHNPLDARSSNIRWVPPKYPSEINKASAGTRKKRAVQEVFPVCKMQSSFPLIYLGEKEFMHIDETVQLFRKMGIPNNPALRNKSWVIRWVGHPRQLEACFDLADIARQTGLSKSYVQGIAKGNKTPHKSFLLFPLKDNPLQGWTREQLTAVLSDISYQQRRRIW